MITIIDDNYNIDKEFFLEKLQEIEKELKLEGEIVIKLGDKEESRQLNSMYRKKDDATDVLSFPIKENLPDGFYLGDISICYPVALEQKEEYQISIEQELFTLMIHGILHLAGYDHETDSGEMLKKEDEIVSRYFSDDLPNNDNADSPQ